MNKILHAELAAAEDIPDHAPGELMYYSAVDPQHLSREPDPFVVHKASTDPDTMYLHQEMNHNDKKSH